MHGLRTRHAFSSQNIELRHLWLWKYCVGENSFLLTITFLLILLCFKQQHMFPKPPIFFSLGNHFPDHSMMSWKKNHLSDHSIMFRRHFLYLRKLKCAKPQICYFLAITFLPITLCFEQTENYWDILISDCLLSLTAVTGKTKSIDNVGLLTKDKAFFIVTSDKWYFLSVTRDMGNPLRMAYFDLCNP